MEEVLEASVGVQAMEHLRLSIGDFLERFKKGHVLILGDFDEAGTARIEVIRNVLRERGYHGMTLQEIKEVPEYDLRQKLTAVATICCFVVVDDSSKAGQLAELPIIEFLRTTVVILRLKGTGSSYVVRPLDATSKVAREVEYDAGSLSIVLQESIDWAESTIGDLRAKYGYIRVSQMA